MTIKEITEFLEDESFYHKWKEKIQLSLTLEELQVIISGLHFLKEKYQKDLEDSKNLEGGRDI